MSKEESLKIMSVKFENEKSIRTINISLDHLWFNSTIDGILSRISIIFSLSIYFEVVLKFV